MEAMKDNEDDFDEGLLEVKPKKRYIKHKLEKKVTVKHFLNKKIVINRNEPTLQLYFDDKFFDGTVYPVYVQITFNRKTTMIKSATSENFTEQAFEYYSNHGFIQKLFEREKNFIEFHFQERYKNYLDSLSERFEISQHNNPLNLFHTSDEEYEMFIERFKDYYDINRFIKEYSYTANEIHKYIDNALYEEIIEFKNNIGLKEVTNRITKAKNESQYENLKLDSINTLPLDVIYKSGIKVKAFELLAFLEARDARFSKLRKRYPSEIWYFSIYYRFLKTNNNSPYQKLPATILDYIEGDFETVFFNTFKNDNQKALMILKDLKLLINKRNIQK